MVKTYKYKSKIATAIAFIAALISYLGKEGLTQILPEEYAFIIPILIFCAGYILTQSTENKRVEIAEQLIHEQYTDPTTKDEILNYDEPIVGEEDAC